MYSVRTKTEVSNMNDEEEETRLKTAIMDRIKLSCSQANRLLPSPVKATSKTRRHSNTLIEKKNHGHHHHNSNMIHTHYLLGYLLGEIKYNKQTLAPAKPNTLPEENCINTNSTSDLNLLETSTTMCWQHPNIDKSIVMQTTQRTDDKRASIHNELAPANFKKRSAIFDHLIKLVMFLMTIICFHTISNLVDCQRHHFNNNKQSANQLISSNEHLIQLQQQLAFDQLIRNSNQQLVASPQRVHRQAVADRRVSPAAPAEPSQQRHNGRSGNQQQQQQQQQQPQQQTQNDSGRLLVCYYTTRQSAPYWPKDAREYVVPPEGFSGFGDLNQATNLAGGGTPIIHYEPSSRQNDASGPQQAHDYGSNLNGLNQNAQNTKNQQQQLVLKSAALPPAAAAGNQLASAGGQSSMFGGKQFDQFSSSHPNYNGIIVSANKSKQDSSNVAVAELAEQQVQQQQQQQQQQVSSAANALHVHHHHQRFDKPVNKHNKQSPVYSFVGEQTESVGNNGLIVGVDGGAFGQNGNNGNNFIISHKDGHNQLQQQQQQERNSMKQAQAQQLVFSPSLSRAFIVGGPANTNNEALDTKSQLFIPQQHQHKHNNNQFSPQQVSSKVSSPKLYQQQQQQQQQQQHHHHHQLQQQQQQQHQHELLMQKGKSLQVTSNFEQLSPAQSGFSGAVSSAPSVPISSASSTLVQQVSPYHHNSALQQQQQPISQQATTNHLIVSSNVQQQQPTPTTSAQRSPTPVGVNNLSSLELQYSTNGDQLLTGGTSNKALAVQPVASPSSSNLAASGSSTSLASGSSAQIRSPAQPASVVAGANTGGLSSALVSSPLSTMFDVFGAASQYLMRFKPSSLISPSSFAFNTISSEHLHQAADGGANSTLIGAPAISTSSLIPVPFPTGLMASLHKSSSSSSSSVNDRSSSGSGAGASSGGILSRFSLQQNNQRREDVCGKTIQTPQRRIIGGEGARYGEFPYQVHIKIAKHQCGGALVDKQSIVTAAHCVYHFITRAPVNKLQIVIGAYDIEDEQYQELPPQYFKVNKVKLHPNFRFSASHPDRYDIAILKLDKPVKYTDNVLPVCLPSRDLKFESMIGTVTGFGKTDPSLSNRYGTRLLQKVDVPIIENNECERWHRTRGIDLKIFPEMMCAGYEDGLKDACVGDSGGPLVVKTASGPNGSFRWTLAGITSAGFGCAQSRQPGIYHRVSHTVDWILDNLD